MDFRGTGEKEGEEKGVPGKENGKKRRGEVKGRRSVLRQLIFCCATPEPSH